MSCVVMVLHSIFGLMRTIVLPRFAAPGDFYACRCAAG
jgi:hypothetical protein